MYAQWVRFSKEQNNKEKKYVTNFMLIGAQTIWLKTKRQKSNDLKFCTFSLESEAI